MRQRLLRWACAAPHILSLWLPARVVPVGSLFRSASAGCSPVPSRHSAPYTPATFAAVPTAIVHTVRVPAAPHRSAAPQRHRPPAACCCPCPAPLPPSFGSRVAVSAQLQFPRARLG